MAKRSRKQTEAEEHTPLFEFSRDFVKSLKVPYEPPPHPRTTAEALFFLSWNGRNCLSDLSRLLRAYTEALDNPARPVVIAVTDKEVTNCPVTEEKLSSHSLSLPALTAYFSGFDALSTWLSHAYTLAFDRDSVPSPQTIRLLDLAWAEGFSSDVGLQQDSDIVKCLDADIADISIHANHQWTMEVYWTLVQEYLERADVEGDEKYATNPAARDKYRIRDRKELYASLARAGIFNVRFSYYISEDEDVFLDESEYKPLLNWLERILLSEGAMSFEDMRWEAAQEWYRFTGRWVPKWGEPLLQPTPPVDKVETLSQSETDETSEDGEKTAIVENQDIDNYQSPSSDGHSERAPATQARERHYSEPMSKADCLRLAQDLNFKLREIDMDRAIKEDPECCIKISRERFQFDMNTVCFSFLKHRGGK